MGRFSRFVTKAGEAVQQASDEYQRTRQQQQQQQQSAGFSGQPTQQYPPYGSGRAYPNAHAPPTASHQQLQPPALPPRRPSESGQYQQSPQNYQASATPQYGQPEPQRADRRSWHNPSPSVQAKTSPVSRQEAQATYHAPGSQDIDADRLLAEQLQRLEVESAAPELSPSPRLPPRPPKIEAPQAGSGASEQRYAAPSVQDEPAPPPPPSTRPVPPSQRHVAKALPPGLAPVPNCIAYPIQANADWFLHDKAPDFLVCSRCYVDYIYQTNLQTLFQHKKFADFEQVPRRCYFSSHNVKTRLWPAALAAGNLDNMLEHMRSRPKLPACPEQRLVENSEWWMSPDIPHMCVCKACFSDDYKGGPFASKFELKTVEQQATCDSFMPFVGRMSEIHQPSNNWAEFAAEVKGRLTIPACPREKTIPGASHAWVRSTREPKGYQTCYACFADYFYGTTSEKHFQQVALDKETTVCLMGILNMKIPAQQAVAKKDPELFWKWIAEVDRQPFCSKQGIKGSTSWYTLPNHPPGFAVCGACRAGIAEPVGWSRHLIPVNADPNDTILCCFNAAHPRFAEFMTCLVPSLATDTWEKLGNHAATYANVPRCPRDNTTYLPNRRYWGWDSLRICQECYLSFARDTDLEPLFHLKGEVMEKSRLCDMYSPRMRKLYTDACQGRITGQQLVDLGGQRRMVYLNTMPEIDRLISQQNIKASQAVMFGNMGTFYKNMGSTQDVLMGHSYTVGNAYAGYGYVNENSLTGAEYDRKGRDLTAEVLNGSVTYKVSVLEIRWREVE
ncbi:hypothetical protein CC79DRAFT_1332559 [Sarocladium strictum]